MQARLNHFKVNPSAMQAMLKLQQRVDEGGIEHNLQELVKIRASQINGCAYCLDMHTRDARKAGESEARIHLLPAWREASLYSPRERAALGWTEAMTRLAETGAPDADYAEMAKHFTPQEQVELMLLIVTINGWNRFAVGFRAQHPVERGDQAQHG